MRYVTKAGFLRRLASQPPNRVVGQAWSTRLCPVATFLKEAHGGERPVVGKIVYSINGVQFRNAPGWMQSAVRAVDAGQMAGARLTASRVRRLVGGQL